jgi:DNA repair exonuclease SbcCD ATPase subunit
MYATAQDISLLERLYKDRNPYHGQLHDHASTGGRSDGKCTLAEWKKGLEELSLDFATILDHRQVRHMHLPEWDETMFIGGTEPGTVIDDSPAEEKMLHYLMIFPKREQLETLLTGLNENIEELNELLGSGDAVQQLLNDYEAYEALLNSDSEAGGALEELEERREKLREMIQSSKNKEYIVRIAKERLGLYFPDEEIFYNDMN